MESETTIQNPFTPANRCTTSLQFDALWTFLIDYIASARSDLVLLKTNPLAGIETFADDRVCLVRASRGQDHAVIESA